MFHSFFPHREHLHNIESSVAYGMGVDIYPDIYPDIARTIILLYTRALDISAKIRMRELQLVTREMASHIAETSGSLKVAFWKVQIVRLYQRIMYLYPSGSV